MTGSNENSHLRLVAAADGGTIKTWLTYVQAAAYTGWSVRYLRNLVSAEQIPVYGPKRSRRFRLDMLDLFLADRGVAMRKFLLERDAHGD